MSKSFIDQLRKHPKGQVKTKVELIHRESDTVLPPGTIGLLLDNADNGKPILDFGFNAVHILPSECYEVLAQ